MLGSVRPRPGKALVLELIRQMELRQNVEMGLTVSQQQQQQQQQAQSNHQNLHHSGSGSVSGSSFSHSVSVLHLQPDEANAVGLLAGGLGGTIVSGSRSRSGKGKSGGDMKLLSSVIHQPMNVDNSTDGVGGDGEVDDGAAELLQNFYNRS